jgi:Flp pilus assembly protein TadB
VTDESAVAIGASVFSEVFVFSVAGAALAFELWKKQQDDDAAKRAKEAAAAKDKRDIEDRFLGLETQLTTVCHQLQNVQHELHVLRDQQLGKKGGSPPSGSLLTKFTGGKR